jgi:hypothetical protein
MVLEGTTRHLLHYDLDIVLVFKDLDHFYYIGVGDHFDDLQLGLDKWDLFQVELVFLDVLHGNDLLRVFVLTLVDSRKLARAYRLASGILVFKSQIFCMQPESSNPFLYDILIGMAQVERPFDHSVI